MAICIAEMTSTIRNAHEMCGIALDDILCAVLADEMAMCCKAVLEWIKDFEEKHHKVPGATLPLRPRAVDSVQGARALQAPDR